MRKIIKQSKKHNFKLYKVTFTKGMDIGDFHYVLTTFTGDFLKNISNRELQEVNKYLGL